MEKKRKYTRGLEDVQRVLEKVKELEKRPPEPESMRKLKGGEVPDINDLDSGA